MVINSYGEGYFEKADVWVEVKYNLKEDTAKINTNLKREVVREFIQEYIRGQFGKGKDESEPEDREEYTIRVACDLNGDIFRATSDTGNKSLRDGILMHVSSREDLEELIAA